MTERTKRTLICGVSQFLLMVLPLLLFQIKWRLSDEPVTESTKPEHRDPGFRSSCRWEQVQVPQWISVGLREHGIVGLRRTPLPCRALIFLGFTSNLGSAGTREHIRCCAVRP